MDQILLIDKPAGITSHDAVDRVRRIFKTRRVGHAGTLDPFATGLLILGIGDATKRLSEYVGLDKTYEATAELGATSTTFDPEGVIVQSTECRVPSEEEIEKAFEKFRGGYDQKAPIYSAKKVGGKKLYELARKGTATENLRPTKHVIISELILIEYEWPTLRFRVTCSSGTYIRSLTDDIGRALGCGGYLSALKRTRIGHFFLINAQTLDTLEKN
ncbi:tRNA pseudouridine(55) synthase TruB [Patescibacteria group bacterium]|nr:tRNA pseudouridine(55) synthase TruB [Patescibacteria group bacterium]MBU1035052.1 tRNA pseudouridine(55) synthase TruB [Patescibacteria group bacterium]MBU1629621.1 tRNA pseudouridine(55) synthase TruB [Patescibacteria group bacterium]MBU1908066.1 tRNA pseudouridine(55) synthase TruB [Patescibacteria group bacterium]